MSSSDPLSSALQHAQTDQVVAPLGRVPAVVLSGPDARRFANGMFTNNVRDLAPCGSQRTGLTDDRGRLWALAELHALSDDRFLLHLDGRSAEEFTERYETYIVFDDVEIVAAEAVGTSVQGPAAAATMQSAGLPTPALGTHVHHEGVLIVGRDRAGVGTGFDLWGPPPLEPDPHGAAVLDALQVAAGQVRMGDVVRPGLPHEHGLRHAILHFEKGCYLGQEAIHRIDVMGKPRRGLAVVSGDTLQLGALTADGKEQGTVTRVVAAADGGLLGLAVLRKPHDDVGAQLTQGTNAVQVVAVAGA